jgi:hypothetical protein
MTAEQFIYWLQGFMEISNPVKLSEKETQIIKDHLKLVFDKKTPDRTITMPGTTTTPLAPMPTTPYPKWQEPHWQPNPFPITCDDNNNFPDLMTTPLCSGTTITTTSLDPDIQKAMDDFAKETKKEIKRSRVNELKC